MRRGREDYIKRRRASSVLSPPLHLVSLRGLRGLSAYAVPSPLQAQDSVFIFSPATGISWLKKNESVRLLRPMTIVGHTPEGNPIVNPLKKTAATKKNHAPKHGAVTTHMCERNERGVMWPTQAMSTLERQFLNCWQHHHGPDIEREALIDIEGGGTRKWRADFVHRSSKTLIEVEGGAWSGGRHTRGKGFIEDAHKYLRAWELGWTVLRLSEGQLNVQDVGRIVAKLRGGKTIAAPAPHWLAAGMATARQEGVPSMGTAETSGVA